MYQVPFILKFRTPEKWFTVNAASLMNTALKTAAIPAQVWTPDKSPVLLCLNSAADRQGCPPGEGPSSQGS